MDPASRFFRTLYAAIVGSTGGLDSGYELELRPFDVVAQPDKPKDRLVGGRYLAFEDVDQAAAAALEHDARGREVYFGVHPRRRGSASAGNDAVPVYVALMADIDVDKHGLDEAHVLDVLHALPFGAPALVVRSGGGLHAYWPYKEPLDADDPDERARHEDAAHLIRWYVHQGVGAAATDDMSSRDRILRVPGTHNWKRERRRPDGSAPPVELLEAHEGRFVSPSDVLACGPTDVPWRDLDWGTAGEQKTRARAAAYDPALLPTTLPERLKRVLAAAGLAIAKIGTDAKTGGIRAVALRQCPACGDTRGKCYITAHGRLKSHRHADCPAGEAQSGYGIPLDQWVARFAPQAKGALQERPEVGQFKRPKRHRVAIALGELADETGESTARAWAAAAGLFPDLGDVAIDAGLFLCPLPGLVAEGASRLAHGLARDRRDNEVLLPLQDVEGSTRQAAWVSPSGRARTLVGFDTESLGDLPESLGVLGSVPSAIAAGVSGRMVVVAADARDWISAQAMRLSGALDAEVLGVLRDRDAKKLCRILCRAWTATNAIPRRVVILRRHEHRPAVATEAARVLAGRAGVAVCEPTTPDPKVGGLTESVGISGPEAAARVLGSTPLTHAPPSDIATAGPELTTFLEQGVRVACSVSTHKRQKLVINVVDAGAGKTTIMEVAGARVACCALRVPVVGGRPRNAEVWPPPGRRVGFWLPTHALAAEKHAQIQGMIRNGTLAGVETLSTVHLKGALEWCAFCDHVREVFPAVGRRGICGDPGKDQRCPEAENGCLGVVEPKIEFGQVAFGAHAMAPNVRQDLAIIDESPGVVDGSAVDGAALASLFTPKVIPRVRRWRNVENPDATIAARLLSDLAQAKANEHADDIGAGRADGYDRHIRGDELVALLDSSPTLVEALRVGAHIDARKPPVPFPNELRAGAFFLSAYPSRAAFDALVALQAHYHRLKTPPLVGPTLDMGPVAPPPIVVLTLRPDRTFALQQYRVRKLPDCPVMILDATGEVTEAEWRAAYPDREVIVRRQRVQGTAPAMALHMETKNLRRSKIWVNGQIVDNAALRLRSVVVRTILETRRRAAQPALPGIGAGGPTIGVLLYKGLHDLIVGGRAAKTPAEQAVANLRYLAGEMETTILWGYYGRHDRGTNEFEHVDGFVTVGDPLENIGHVELQAELLRLAPDVVGKARTMATLIQAIFRARHTRRDASAPVVLAHAGETPPAVDGLEWERKPLVEHGRPANSGKLGLAYSAVEYAAERLDDIVGAKLMAWFDWGGSPFNRDEMASVSYSTWHDACRRYAHARNLVEVTVATSNRRPGVYFGPSTAATSQLVSEVLGEKTTNNGPALGRTPCYTPQNTPKQGAPGVGEIRATANSPYSQAIVRESPIYDLGGVGVRRPNMPRTIPATLRRRPHRPWRPAPRKRLTRGA